MTDPPMTQAERFYRDMLADCMTNVLADQWRERAQVFRDARPREGDFHGQSTIEERRERWRRLTAIAKACEARADLLDAGQAGLPVPDLDDFPLWEAA